MSPANPSNRERTKWTSSVSALTAVELLVVVGVIALLASLLLPAIARTKSTARSAQCKANLHQLGFALRMYVDDFGKYPLLSSPIDPTRSTGPWKEWPHDLASYLQMPIDRALSDNHFLCSERHRAESAVSRPSPNPNRGAPYNAYGYNGSGCAADGDRYGLGLGNPSWMDFDFPRSVWSYRLRLVETSESKVKQPDDMISITCSDLPGQRSVGPAFVLAQFWPGRSHRGGANILFCDAHVDFGNQGKWIEKTDRARRRWNNDHEPHWEALR